MTEPVSVGATEPVVALPRKPALVVSHERSGTHFLMNTLAANFGYTAQPWVNLDFEQGLNFHSPRTLLQGLVGVAERDSRHVVKSHHAFGFFAPILEPLFDRFEVFYVVREPAGVMASFRRMISSFAWHEGPRTADLHAFLESEPEGNLLRYQKQQSRSMLHRWSDHVRGWLMTSPQALRDQIVVVRYDRLDGAFEETVRSLGSHLRQSVANPLRPERTTNVVAPHERTAAPPHNAIGPGVRARVTAEFGAVWDAVIDSWPA